MTSLREEIQGLIGEMGWSPRTEARHWIPRLEAILARHPDPADVALEAFTRDGPGELRLTGLTAVQAHGSDYESVYGLDRDGCVHELDFRAGVWKPIPMRRAP